jgi:hypothetical protein
MGLIVIKYLNRVNLRLDRVESCLVGDGSGGLESHILASALMLSYHESKNNIEFRRALYFAALSVRGLCLTPLVILWAWGVVAMHTVNPPAVGWALLTLGTSAILGLFGLSLWKRLGWRMTPLSRGCLGVSVLLGILFVAGSVFVSPSVLKGGRPVDLRALSVVFATLNLIPLIFRAFTSDRALSRSMTQVG